MKITDVALICKALSDSNRLKIIKILTDGELCACELLEHFKITQPTLSHHMKVLAECALINSRKDSTKIIYSLNCETLTDFRNFISELNCKKNSQIDKNP